MAQIQLKNPASLQGWQFTTVADMAAVLESLAEDGFKGTVKSYQNQEELVWQLTIKVPDKSDQHVYLSPASDPNMATWLVYDGVAPVAYTQSAFEARYEIAE